MIDVCARRMKEPGESMFSRFRMPIREAPMSKYRPDSAWSSLREKIEHYLEPDENGCLIWPRALNPNGYGHVRWHRKSFAVHRQYWIETGREIPEGMELDHLCRVPACANPDHLEPVTHTENVRRGTAGWQYRAKTHCIHGHEFTQENTVIRSGSGHRDCRECMRQRSREYRARLKASL